MGLSSTQRHLISDVVGWCALAGALFFVASHFNEVRALVESKVSLAPAASKPSEAALAATNTAPSGDGVELRAGANGHFAADIDVNGRRLDALVDTGATIVLLTYEDAARAGIFLRASDFTMSMETANGRAKAAPVTLERVSIGNIVVRNVQAAVAERGRLNVNLLGMSFLQKLRKFEINSGRLLLQD